MWEELWKTEQCAIKDVHHFLRSALKCNSLEFIKREKEIFPEKKKKIAMNPVKCVLMLTLFKFKFCKHSSFWQSCKSFSLTGRFILKG